METIEEIIKHHCYITQDGIESVHSSLESVKDAMEELHRQTVRNANLIIIPASEILPETYFEDLNNWEKYLNEMR